LNSTFIAGPENGDLRLVLNADASAHIGAGFAGGKGFEFGGFLGDVSDFQNSTAFSLDTFWGSFSLYVDPGKNFISGFRGAGLGGPSFGIAATAQDPRLTASKSIFDFTLSDIRNKFSKLSAQISNLCP